MADPMFQAVTDGVFYSEDPKLAAYKLMVWAKVSGLDCVLTIDGDRYTVTIAGCEPTTYTREVQTKR